MFTCTLRADSRKTLCEQLYEALRRQIGAGGLADGEKLPSKRALAAHLGVSTSTVEAAYGRLMEEGLCESRPRSGLYVTAGPAAGADAEKPPEIRWDFGTGAADAEHFPYATWAHLMRGVLGRRSADLLLAGDPRGSAGLRLALSGLVQRLRGITAAPETLIVGAGTEVLVSDVLALVGRDRLFAVEDPGYPRVRRILSAGGARIAPIPLSGGALDVRALYRSGAGAVYVTPSHQFPTGSEMDEARRAALLVWARETGGYILEDDYDSEFRFDGKNIPAMRGRDARVIYLNTFSRTLAPGLRMGFMVLPEQLVPRYMEQHSACSVPAFQQETLEGFIAGGHMERHIARMRTLYRGRLQALRRGVETLDLGRLHPCDAGLYALLEAGGKTPAGELVPAAARAGVRLTRLSDYALMEGAKQDRTVLLGFAGMDEERILEGLDRLAGAWGIRGKEQNPKGGLTK